MSTSTAFRQLRTKKRLLMVGHSYVRRANRLQAEAIQEASHGEWEVTVAAPSFYQGHPRFGFMTPETLVVDDSERVEVIGIPVAFSIWVHGALFGTQLRTLMARGFDAVHCWEEPYVLSSSQMASWAPPDAILTVQTWQNINKSFPPPFNWVERRVMARADGWVGGASLVVEALKDRPGYRDRPHRIMGFGVDLKRFRPDPAARKFVRASLGWTDDDTRVIGFLSRFREDKGLRVMMRALDGLSGPWRALFVGGGALEGELRRWAERYGTNVRIVSNVEPDGVPPYLNAMDLLCVPSQTTATWREQFGRVLIEAFACGVCVVASDSAEIPYVVANAGSIVGERDEAGWRREIESLLRDDVRRNDLAARGLERATTQFTWNAIGTRYLEFFDFLQRSKRPLASRNT